MKTPLVIMLIIVVAILGFLVVYSQQHEMTGTAPGEHGAAGGYGAAPQAGGYGSAPAAGGYGAAPQAGGYGAPPAAPSGGYGK